MNATPYDHPAARVVGRSVPAGDVSLFVRDAPPSDGCPRCRLGTFTFTSAGHVYEQAHHYAGCPDNPGT